MAEQLTRKKHGFAGQKAIVIPRKIIRTQCEQSTMISPLYITDIGYYPKAKFHYRERSHGTDQHIIIYCIEGKGWARIKSIDYTIRAGEFIIVPAHIPHKYSADESDPWTIYWIHFKGNQAASIVAFMQNKLDGQKGFLHFTQERIGLFNNMYEQLQRGYGTDNLAFANMALWYYLTTFVFQHQQTPAEFTDQDNINSAIDLMGKKIEHMLSLEEIAKHVNLSSSHFSALFKKRTGFSPIEYFNHLKIQKACQYLLFSELLIKEIAYKLGIEDPYYFSRLFTKIMGISPNEYRERRNH